MMKMREMTSIITIPLMGRILDGWDISSVRIPKTIDNESFFQEMSCNTSIKKVHFESVDLSDGLSFTMLDPFFKKNHNLTKIELYECELGVEDARQLSLAIGNCGNSLKELSITDNDMANAQIVGIITALSMHPQLEELDFMRMNIGRNECMALATLFYTTNRLRVLNLSGMYDIYDEGLDILVKAFPNTLQELTMALNLSVTINGWKRVATLLELPKSNLKKLLVSYNNNGNFGDEGAMVFANALKNNSTLKTLSMIDCGVTPAGWAPFSKLLCDTSSVNNTYLSNHTLRDVSGMTRANSITSDTLTYLEANRSSYSYHKNYIARKKIIRYHSLINVQPFFEWELNFLPIIISWFTITKVAAFSATAEYDEKIKKMKLSVVYDFIKEFPMLYIEPITRKEIADYTVLEEELQGDELEKIQQRKARAMKRLF